jgi:hypothetical protein
MNKTAGTVQLNNTTLRGGSWTNSTTYTIAYNGLTNSTEYMVNITGFKDVASNEMTGDNSHKFTTAKGDTPTPTPNPNPTPTSTPKPEPESTPEIEPTTEPESGALISGSTVSNKVFGRLTAPNQYEA